MTRFMIWWYLLRIRLSGAVFFVTLATYAPPLPDKWCDGLIRSRRGETLWCPLKVIGAYGPPFSDARLHIIFAADNPRDVLRPRLMKACGL